MNSLNNGLTDEVREALTGNDSVTMFSYKPHIKELNLLSLNLLHHSRLLVMFCKSMKWTSFMKNSQF